MDPNSVEFLEQLLTANRIMAENRDLDALLDYALQAAMESVEAEQGHIILLEGDNAIKFRVSHGAQDEVSTSIIEQVIQDQKPLRITDALYDEEFANAQSVKRFQLRSVMAVPLIVHHKVLGVVYLENRSKANIFRAPHLDALVLFSKQAAALIDHAQLTETLKKARQELVTTREEERRRMRYDLHNDLGPSLAALRLQVDAAQNMLHAKDPMVEKLLDTMQEQVQQILIHVREVVYALRPPVIDELGLLAAIQEMIATTQPDGRLQFAISLPPKLPPLSAAVEVALYRCVRAAIQHVRHYTDVHRCDIRLFVDNSINLSITHDGQQSLIAIDDDQSLAAMRLNTIELRGRFTMDTHPAITVNMILPIG